MKSFGDELASYTLADWVEIIAGGCFVAVVTFGAILGWALFA